MPIEALVRANLWAERHRRLVLAVTVAAFAISCAHYARFIRLPEVVALPVVATGLLAGLRYAIWDGWLKRIVEARAQAERQADPPQVRSREASASPAER